MDENLVHPFFLSSNCQQVVDCSNQKKIKLYDYAESFGFYNNSNVVRKKYELKGVRNLFRTPFLNFLGERH